MIMKRYKSYFEANRPRTSRKDFNLNNYDGMINKKMSPDVYKLRKEVMNYIYRAKKLVGGDLPRVDVRITNDSVESVLGVARLNDNIIWVPEESIHRKDVNLQELVYHELIHACFGYGHDKSGLMSPHHSHGKFSPEKLDQEFVRHYNIWKNK